METGLKAFYSWYQQSGYARRFYKYERALDFLLNPEMELVGLRGWLKIARSALFLTSTECAKRAKISQSLWIMYERSEERGTIQIRHLEALANSLDCDFIYALIPKKKKLFSRIVWTEFEQEALKCPRINSETRSLVKSQLMTALALRKMQDPIFRKERNWSKKRQL